MILDTAYNLTHEIYCISFGDKIFNVCLVICLVNTVASILQRLIHTFISWGIY